MRSHGEQERDADDRLHKDGAEEPFPQKRGFFGVFFRGEKEMEGRAEGERRPEDVQIAQPPVREEAHAKGEAVFREAGPQELALHEGKGPGEDGRDRQQRAHAEAARAEGEPRAGLQFMAEQIDE